MTGHQINSLVGDLVAMAQAMERLPQVEAELADARNVLVEMDKAQDSLKADLEQSRSYAASLEAKVHAAEASRDDAELRFLEAEEQTAKVRALVVDLAHVVEPPTLPMPEPILSEVKPIAADPIGVNATENGPQNVSASIGSALPYLDNPLQGQSEADPTTLPVNACGPDTNTHSIMDASVNGAASTSGASIAPSWATPTPPKPQPYAGHSYGSWPGCVNRQDWIEGGGTNESYDDLPF